MTRGKRPGNQRARSSADVRVSVVVSMPMCPGVCVVACVSVRGCVRECVRIRASSAVSNTTYRDSSKLSEEKTESGKG